MSVSQSNNSFRPHLMPVLRIAARDPGFDVSRRFRDCIAGFLPPIGGPKSLASDIDGTPIADLTSLLFDIDRTGQLLVVPDPALGYARLPANVRKSVQVAADALLRTVEPYLAPSLGTVTRLELSCLSTSQSELAVGTVVLVRQSDEVTEQYAFPNIRIDPGSGVFGRVPSSASVRPMSDSHSRGIHILAGKETAEKVIGAAMAVTPFFPPPVGPVLTGALAVANLVLGLLPDADSKGPTPLELATKSIESFTTDSFLKMFAGTIAAQANQFSNACQSQKDNVDTLSSIDGGISDMLKMLRQVSTPLVVTTNGQLYEYLKSCDTTNFEKSLSLLVSGITTELLMYHAQMAIRSVEASIQYRHQHLVGYHNATSALTALAGTVALDIGTTHSGDWTEELITSIMGQSTSYMPKIEAWMAKAKSDRLAKISSATPWTEIGGGGYQSNPWGGGYVVNTCGWTFTDQGIDGDHGQLANYIENSAGARCSDHDIEHQDTVQQNMLTYKTTIAKAVDTAFAPHQTVMASWTTYIADLLTLLPPAIPKVPTVSAPPTGGTATPAGEWVVGDDVRYALMARRDKGGLSPASDWSKPLAIGNTLGAVLSGIQPVDGADSIVVVRQFRPRGAADWSPESEQVAVLQPPFPASYTDTNPGGNPWGATQ
jgi:hypothetical protein